MQAFFSRIAGVDPVALEDCPATDRVWVAQLGFSLLLNYVVVFGLTYYSIGFFVAEIYTRVLVAIIVASVITTFDRALFQFDWFTISLLNEARDLIGAETVFVSTNVTSDLMMEAIDNVIWSLRLFDHLIIDLSRFGEVRDVPSQRALITKLQERGFGESEQVYLVGDTDIRHFSLAKNALRGVLRSELV